MYLVGIKHGEFIELNTKDGAKEHVMDLITDGYSPHDIVVYKSEEVPFEVKINVVEVVW